ncbi:2Fe-2S iron-sulfur cluster-binding protein [Qipengyuania profunda]|jgi:2Fe-2S ferredoxin|uniref:2Fe-2S iron-sulfur cluster-binding protein n=1 Tax=Qipengyuania profunda TaxID=3113984 RepID=UPI002A18C5A7|nr:2Fe-2S iron-sulfur cluster-binding protein [Qipengyuania sp. HL-TH1]WPL56959.1 2Fe-2S iron-sulfur cluster-binding protein [Qipengyuania sp. HL-TH5]
MIKLHIKNLSGTEQTVEVAPDGSLMEAIRDSGFQDLLALCGGCCSCATCHIVVESDFVAPEPMSSEEDDLLDGSDHRQAGSRLSCQIPLTDACDGLRLRIVPAD